MISSLAQSSGKVLMLAPVIMATLRRSPDQKEWLRTLTHSLNFETMQQRVTFYLLVCPPLHYNKKGREEGLTRETNIFGERPKRHGGGGQARRVLLVVRRGLDWCLRNNFAEEPPKLFFFHFLYVIMSFNSTSNLFAHKK